MGGGGPDLAADDGAGYVARRGVAPDPDPIEARNHGADLIGDGEIVAASERATRQHRRDKNRPDQPGA